MQGIAYVIVVVLAIIIVTLAVRLGFYRSQIKHIKDELSMLNREDTNYRLSSCCSVGKTNELIDELNKVLDKYREELRFLRNDNRLYKESITSISHDIRTPLTSAKGYVQMLSKGELPEEKRQEYVLKIEKRIDDVTAMLNQLFEYTRVEAGELEFVPERINLNNIFVEVISMFYEEFTAKGCEPVIDVAEEPCDIYADKSAVIRIVTNLTKNALVHGMDNYVFRLKKVQGRVELSVANRTDSIERADVDRIFDRFYTTDKSRTRKTTGLGLAIVKRFVTQMGGEVKAELEGDVFTVKVEFVESKA